MYSRIAADRKRGSAFLVGYANSSLPFHHRQVPLDRQLQAGLIEHHRVERLRQAADLFQRALRDFAHLEQFRAKRGIFRRQTTRSSQHCRSQDLPELVVQFAGNMAQRGFLRRDQSLRQFAALCGKRFKAVE